MNALPFIDTGLIAALVVAFFKLSFQAGSLVRHVDDINDRVRRLEGQQDSRVALAHGGD